jgi:glycosyl transferase family 1
MIKNESIIWFAGFDWWAHYRRNEMFTTEYFAKHNKVLFVNSIGMGLPRPGEPGVPKRMWRKFKSLTKWFVRTDKGVIVCSPFFIPAWSLKPIIKLNKKLIIWQLRRMMKKAGMENPIIISSIPTTNEFIDLIPHKTHVYFLFDNFAAYHEDLLFLSAKKNDFALRESADVVICTSKGLYNEVSENRPHVFWIPHGVHPDILHAPLDVPEPREIVEYPHPRISYWGIIDHNLNEPLLAELAIKRPKWHFFFYGPKNYSYPSIEGLPNIHFMGYAPQANLNRVGHYSDVLIMPWKDSEWIRSQCPIKYREYLAIGKPVVSAPSDEVELAYPGAAIIAQTTEEWIDGIERSLRENSPAKEAMRRNLVQGYDMNAADKLHNETIEYALALKQA